MRSKIFSDGRITLIFHKKDSEFEILSTLESKYYSVMHKHGTMIIGPNDIIRWREADGSLSKTEDILQFLKERDFKEVK
jgi:hypothetical protein